jgi:hypothetical protein
MSQSTATLAKGKAAKKKPPKPYPEFPMYAYPSGNWARKLKPRGAVKPKVFYFGPWGRRVGGELIRLEDDGCDAALKKYKAESDNIRAGRPRKAASRDGLTVKDLCNRFLNAKRRLRENGELAWSTGTPDDAIAKEVRKLLDETKLYRRGIGFYTMRHIFRTVADATRDFPAVRLVMGHVDSSMDDVYRERIEDERLEAVAKQPSDYLRKRLGDIRSGNP